MIKSDIHQHIIVTLNIKKERQLFMGKTLELRDFTYHKWQCSALTPARQLVLNLPKGWKAEST